MGEVFSIKLRSEARQCPDFCFHALLSADIQTSEISESSFFLTSNTSLQKTSSHVDWFKMDQDVLPYLLCPLMDAWFKVPGALQVVKAGAYASSFRATRAA